VPGFAKMSGMTVITLPGWRTRFLTASDVLATALAASLPWSTSATAILVVLWLVAFIPVMDRTAVRQVASSPAGAFPLALWVLAAISCLWSEASWTECWRALSGFHKLLLLPLFVVQFRASPRGHWVLVAYLTSCAAVLAVSFVGLLWPSIGWRDEFRAGIPVKDHSTQSTEFLICAFALAAVVPGYLESGRKAAALGLVVLMVLFLGNIFYVAAARASLLAIGVLLLVFAWRFLSPRGLIGLSLAAGVAAAAVWASSPYLRIRVTDVSREVQEYVERNESTSSGIRLEFWKKSARFIAQAPVFGHGVGSIPILFERAADDSSRISAMVTKDPHNQALKIGIELGSVGIALLLALWGAHLLLFARAPGLVAWFGLVLVVQNIVNAQFATRLLDFTQGWTYVIGVGVLAGMVWRR
jgi:O-antigen ligase